MYYIREDEEQRYGRNKSTQINKSYIESGEYRRKFDKITDSASFNKLIYKCAKQMLFHRSGTKYEDMYWLDMENETVICSKLDESKEQTIRMTDAISRRICKCNQILPIHSHPSSMPPSPDDFNCMLHDNYQIGLIICHDGTIFKYSAKHAIDKNLWDMYISNFLKEDYDMYDAQILALNKFKSSGDIDYEEVLL